MSHISFVLPQSRNENTYSANGRALRMIIRASSGLIFLLYIKYAAMIVALRPVPR